MNWQINHHLPGIMISCISVTWWPASITPTRISLSSERLKSSAMSLTIPIGIWSPPTVQQESDRLSHHRQSGSRKQSSRNLKLRRWAWRWGHWGWVFGNYSTCNVLHFKQRSGRCHNHFSEALSVNTFIGGYVFGLWNFDLIGWKSVWTLPVYTPQATMKCLAGLKCCQKQLLSEYESRESRRLRLQVMRLLSCRVLHMYPPLDNRSRRVSMPLTAS